MHSFAIGMEVLIKKQTLEFIFVEENMVIVS